MYLYLLIINDMINVFWGVSEIIFISPTANQ